MFSRTWTESAGRSATESRVAFAVASAAARKQAADDVANGDCRPDRRTEWEKRLTEIYMRERPRYLFS